MKKISIGSIFYILSAVYASAGSWSSVDQYIPVRQKAFCNLMNQYELKAQNALESKNQIKQNQVSVDRGQDLLALMPKGEFTNWLVQVEEVFVVANGDAAYDMKLQCGVSIGSGQVAKGQEYVATAPRGSVIYNQLSGVSGGDFILVNGNLVKFDKLNENDGMPEFVSTLKGQTVKQYTRFNDRVKYFADVSSLAKFTSN